MSCVASAKAAASKEGRRLPIFEDSVLLKGQHDFRMSQEVEALVSVQVKFVLLRSHLCNIVDRGTL